jgi:hypothetical protein
VADDEQPDLSEFEGGDAESDADGEAGPGPGSSGETGVDPNPETEPEPNAETGSDPNAETAVDPNADTDVSDVPSAEAARPVSELDRSERVELGVDLLAHIERESLSLSEAVDRIESVTTNPALTREILDTAELRGVIEREEGRLRTRRGGTFVRFERRVVEREGDYECRRCGAGLSTGHFVRFESGELGPFGPSCVRKVLGRE